MYFSVHKYVYVKYLFSTYTEVLMLLEGQTSAHALHSMYAYIFGLEIVEKTLLLLFLLEILK